MVFPDLCQKMIRNAALLGRATPPTFPIEDGKSGLQDTQCTDVMKRCQLGQVSDGSFGLLQFSSPKYGREIRNVQIKGRNRAFHCLFARIDVAILITLQRGACAETWQFTLNEGEEHTALSVSTMSYGRSRDSRGNGGRGLGFGGGRPPMGPKPVEVGKEYDVEVTELSRRGDGVAKVQGFVIFVQGAKVGQKVKIKVDRVGPRFASASVVGSGSESSSSSGETSAAEASSSVTEDVTSDSSS